MSASKFIFYLFSALTIFSILFNFLVPIDTKFSIFFYSFIIHILVLCYIICSFLEINVLQEKQGSKLDLSKTKLSSDRS